MKMAYLMDRERAFTPMKLQPLQPLQFSPVQMKLFTPQQAHQQQQQQSQTPITKPLQSLHSYQPFQSSTQSAYPQSVTAPGQTQQGDQISLYQPSIALRTISLEVQTLAEAASWIERELDYDEKRVDAFSTIDRRDSGHYVYTSDHLSVHRRELIPSVILEAYKDVRAKSIVGLFPDIHRAFITVDHQFFLWNYENSSEVYSYTEQNQFIVSVGLIRPKRDIFDPSISHLIVLSTPVEIFTFAVSFPQDLSSRNAIPSSTAQLTLYPTQYCISSDNVSMLCILGIRAGRIMMGGADGHLYELEYNAQDSLWKRKCRKVRHSAAPYGILQPVLPTFITGGVPQGIVQIVEDHTRNFHLLYTLTADSHITVYSLGNDGQSCLRLASHEKIWEDCKSALSTIPLGHVEDWSDRKEFQVIRLHIIPKSESETIVVMAVTSHAHRIYFSLDRSNVLGYNLKVNRIRLSPPGAVKPDARHQRFDMPFDPAFKRGQSPSSVHATYYRDGVLLLADNSRANTNDTFIAIHRSLSFAYQRLLESVEALAVLSQIADISELPTSSYMNTIASCLYARGQQAPLAGLNELATQHVLPPRVFLVLSASGLLQLVKWRPIDELCSILSRRLKTNDDTELSQFFAQYGAKEACAMCLILTCLPASQALALLPAGDQKPTISTPQRTPPRTPQIDVNVGKLAERAFFRCRTSPSTTSFTSAPSFGSLATSYPTSGLVASSAHQSSARVQGFILYLSRLLRPLWDWSMVVYDSTNVNNLHLRFGLSHLKEIQAPLLHLEEFLVRFLQICLQEYSQLTDPAVISQVQPNSDQELQSDISTLEKIRSLLTLTSELLSFLILVSSSSSISLASTTGSTPFSTLATSLTDPEKAELRTRKMYDLLTSTDGHKLITKLMNTFSEQKHLDTHSPISVRIENFRGAAHSSSFPIESIALQLAEVHKFTTVVELALTRLDLCSRREIEPPRSLFAPSSGLQLTGTTSISGNLISPLVASAGDDKYYAEEKRRCYTVIFQVLGTLLGCTTPTSSYPQPCLPVNIDVNADDTAEVNKILSTCIGYTEHEFHEQLYSYLLENSQFDLLYQIQSPFIIPFLQKEDKYVEILRDYYLRHRMFARAAILLHQLSYNEGPDYSMSDRIGFLTRAFACANAALEEMVTSNQEMISLRNEIDERLTVARIQGQMYAKLAGNIQQDSNRGLPQTNEFVNRCQGGIKRLDSKVFDLMELYEIAQEFELFEICLQIWALGGVRGRMDVVSQLWKNIFLSEIKLGMERKNRMGSSSGALQGDQGDWRLVVQNRFVELAAIYNRPERDFVFPLETIMNILEEIMHNYSRIFASELTPEQLSLMTDNFVKETLRKAHIAPDTVLRRNLLTN